MPRRRSPRPWLAVALVLTVAAAAAAAWLAAGGRLGVATPPRPPAASGPDAAPASRCALVDAAALAQRLPGDVRATATGVEAGVPASASCALAIGGARLSLTRFDTASLARLAPPMTPAAYFDSLAVGLEYEFKAEPETIAGLGARAVAGGFDADGDDPAQIVWQRGEAVYVLAARDRLPRARLLAVARAIDATAP